MKKNLALLLILSLTLSAFRLLDPSLFKVPENWPEPFYDFRKNPLTKEKIELGRALFYESALSRDNTINCGNCHSNYTAFTHIDHAFSHGIDNKTGIRNSPALVNLAWQNSFMWDGAINHLDMQALAPISNPIEMDEKIENVVIKLQKTKLYPALFYRAFGDSIITGEHTLKAISQFLLSIVSSESKYDSVMRKQTTFTAQEANGYRLFKENCVTCHTEPLFTNSQFENNGLKTDSTLKDLGRMTITKNSNDSLKFKVPTLRNIEFSYPYMHDGRFKTIGEVLNHYTKGVQKSKTLSKNLQKSIVMTSNEKVDVTAFLLTLTDMKFLFNKDFAYPFSTFANIPKEK